MTIEQLAINLLFNNVYESNPLEVKQWVDDNYNKLYR